MASYCGPRACLRSFPCERPCYSFPAFCSVHRARRADTLTHSASAARSLSGSAAPHGRLRCSRRTSLAVFFPRLPSPPAAHEQPAPNRTRTTLGRRGGRQKSGRGRRWQKEFLLHAAARSDAGGRSPICSTGNASCGLRAALGPAKDGGLSRCRSMHESDLPKHRATLV